MVAKHVSAQAQTNVIGVTGNVSADFSKIQKNLGDMAANGMPAAINYSDPSVKSLLANLALLNNAIPISEDVFDDPIPISGATSKEQFRSLNTWLGKKADAPWDPATVNALQTKIEGVLAASSADDGAKQLVAALPPSTSAQSAGPVTAAPSVSLGVVPSKPTSDSLRAENEQLLSDLSFIAENGAKKTARQAKVHTKALNAQFDARKINTKKADKAVAAAQKFVDANFAKTIVSKVETSQTVVGVAVSDAQLHPLTPKVTELLTYFQIQKNGTMGEVNVTELLSDIWLLGDQPMKRTLALLEGARTDIYAVKDGDASAKVKEAKALLDAQLAFYKKFTTELTLPTAQASLDEIKGSSLPIKTVLNGDKGANYLIRATGKSANGKSNSKEDLESVFSARVKEVQTLLNAEKVSFQFAFTLYTAVSTDERWMHNLVELWNYAQSNGMSPKPAANDDLWKSYSTAALTFVDPEFNPYLAFTQNQRDNVIRSHMSVPLGTQLTAQQRKKAESEIIPTLSHSLRYKYDDVTFNFYQGVVKLAPRSENTSVGDLAMVRSTRQIFEMLYSSHTVAGSGKENQPARFAVARNYLSSMIDVAKKSGMKEGDAVLNAASAQFKAAASAPKPADVPAASEKLYAAALGLAAIAEANAWSANDSFRSSDLAPATVSTAKSELDAAKKQYLWAFSKPGLEPVYHVNLARRLADGATSMLAPTAFALTEGHAMFYCRGAAANPSLEGVSFEQSETELLAPDPAQVQAAYQADARNLALLLKVKDTPTFVSPATDAITKKAGLGGPVAGINFGVGQVAAGDLPGFTDLSFPQLPKTAGRIKPTVSAVDTHYVPFPNKINYQIGGTGHEDVEYYSWGQLYSETLKQVMIAYDDGAPALLRNLKTAPSQLPVRTDFHKAEDTELKTRVAGIATSLKLPADKPLLYSLNRRMVNASTGYATKTPVQQQAYQNTTFLLVLDTRIAELETRLNFGQVQLKEGKVVAVKALKSSKDPGAYYVTRAEEMLTTVKTLRGQFAKAPGADTLNRGVDLREAIAIAENGIESLSDEHLNGLAPPSSKEYPISISQDVETEAGVQYVRATAKLGGYTPQSGDSVTYHFFPFQDLGTKDNQDRTMYYLRNPRYGVPGQDEFIGMVVRGATLADGKATGDFVVRIRPTMQPGTTGRSFEPVAERDGKFLPKNVLFEVKGGINDLNPVLGPQLDAVLSDVARNVVRVTGQDKCEIRVPRNGETDVKATYTLGTASNK